VHEMEEITFAYTLSRMWRKLYLCMFKVKYAYVFSL